MTEPTTNEAESTQGEQLVSGTDVLLLKMIAMVGMATIFMGTAAAQSDPICTNGEASVISDFINAVIQIATYGGLMASAATFFGTSAVEAAPVSEERRESLKSLRKKSFSASLKLVIGGPILYVLITQSNMPWGDCITLIPF